MERCRRMAAMAHTHSIPLLSTCSLCSGIVPRGEGVGYPTKLKPAKFALASSGPQQPTGQLLNTQWTMVGHIGVQLRIWRLPGASGSTIACLKYFRPRPHSSAAERLEGGAGASFGWRLRTNGTIHPHRSEGHRFPFSPGYSHTQLRHTTHACPCAVRLVQCHAI